MLKIDYKFKDESLLRLAMTHSSYANEHHGTHLQCNERLEFLGDSVLGFVTAGYLFTHYPDLPEGDLTKLRAAVVCEGALDEIAHEIGIPEAIRLGHGEEMGGGSVRIHRDDIQARVLDVLGITKEEADEKFGFLLEAFKYGAPPHAGLALGWDRTVSILAGADSIRDVIAFPKAGGGRDPLTGAPAPISDEQRAETGVDYDPEEDED